VTTYTNFHVVDHPLVHHKLAYIRNRHTGKKEFKEFVDEIGMILAIEATRDLPLTPMRVETPLMETECMVLGDLQVVVVPILRAGVGLVDGFLKVLPTAKVGHVGLYRNEETFEPVRYYFKIPPVKENHRFILVDPMLATGGSAIESARILKEAGVRHLSFACLIAAPEGVEAFCTAHPDVPVFAAALDEKLNEKAYILPGLGDAGDRLFGTL